MTQKNRCDFFRIAPVCSEVFGFLGRIFGRLRFWEISVYINSFLLKNYIFGLDTHPPDGFFTLYIKSRQLPDDLSISVIWRILHFSRCCISGESTFHHR